MALLKIYFIRGLPILIVAIFLSFYIYSHRANYLQPFDTSYWKDRFEHSQWVLPLSRRTIGDDALFSYLGYRMVLGDDPTTVNAETLPIGKYLIGLSIIYFGNPSYYALFTGIFTLIAFFGLSKKLFHQNYIAIVLTSLLALEPLFFTQLHNAWIDLLQLFLLLSHWLLLLSVQKRLSMDGLLLALTSGISLGLFTETKLPITVPIIIAVDIVIIWKNKIDWKYIAPMVAGFTIAILASYTRFFLVGNSIQQFITVQKYIASFYLSSHLTFHFLSVWQTLIIGKYPSIYGDRFEIVTQWTITWLILFVNALSVLYWTIKEKVIFLICLIVFAIGSLALFSFIPFYPRYLTLVIPFLYILFGFTLMKLSASKYSNVLLLLLVTTIAFTNWRLLYPSSESTVNQFFHNMSYKFFQDIYAEDITLNSKNISQYRFRRLITKVLHDAGIEYIEYTKGEVKKVSHDKEVIPVIVTYKTRLLGSFTEKKEIIVVRENNKWKIVWDWDFVLNDFQPNYSVTSTITPGKRGTIRDQNSAVLAQDKLGYLMQVDISKVEWSREKEMLQTLSRYALLKSVHIQNAYLENPLPDMPIDITTNFIPLTAGDIATLSSYPGINLVNYHVREYVHSDPTSIENILFNECCTRIYSARNYEGINSFEKKYNNKLKGADGGTILLLDENKKVIREVLNREALNGQDMIAE